MRDSGPEHPFSLFSLRLGLKGSVRQATLGRSYSFGSSSPRPRCCLLSAMSAAAFQPPHSRWELSRGQESMPKKELAAQAEQRQPQRSTLPFAGGTAGQGKS